MGARSACLAGRQDSNEPTLPCGVFFFCRRLWILDFGAGTAIATNNN
jgi:hypothetical protein